MSLSAIFILDINGLVLISRDYKGHVPSSVIEDFMQILNSNESIGNQSPVLLENGISYAYVRQEDIYIVSVMKNNANILVVFTFMYHLINIMKNYFNKLEGESIRDNFVLIYELLDEVMDFGHPQITNSKVLQIYITQEGYKLKRITAAPAVVTNVVSWRPEGIKYRRNELFIDVIESVNLLVSSKGAILQNEVSGCVKMKVHLSGMPQLRLGVSDKILLAMNPSGSTMHFEDVKFHQCVQLSRIQDKNIYFIPPDGEFELMAYRLNTDLKPLILVDVKVDKKSNSRIHYFITAIAQFKTTSTASHVEVVVPVPQDADSPILKASVGTVVYCPEQSAIVWKIKYLAGGREEVLTITFQMGSIRAEDKEERVPVQVKFVIPYFTISGLQIRFVKVVERSNYKALTWVRYCTKNGEYFIACNL